MVITLINHIKHMTGHLYAVELVLQPFLKKIVCAESGYVATNFRPKKNANY